MSIDVSNSPASKADDEENRAPARTGAFAGLSLFTGLGAAVASSCCALPLALATVGISGAWVGKLGGLLFYKDYFLVAAIAALVLGWVVALRRRAKACDADTVCQHRSTGWITFGALGISTVLVGFASASDWLEPLIVRYLLALNGSA